MSFGGRSWPINPADMNLGPISRTGQTCIGAIFDLGMGSNIPANSGPGWVIGDTFLVRKAWVLLSECNQFTRNARKMCTPSTGLTLLLSASPSSRQLLVDLAWLLETTTPAPQQHGMWSIVS